MPTWVLDIDTVAEPTREGFDSDVADTVTADGLGAAAGAVYKPVEVIWPHKLPEHPLPDRLHSTTPLPGPLAVN